MCTIIYVTSLSLKGVEKKLFVCRWIHATCDGLKNEDDVEAALDYGYHCMLCRPTTGVSGPCKFDQLYLILNQFDSAISF